MRRADVHGILSYVMMSWLREEIMTEHVAEFWSGSARPEKHLQTLPLQF